jgi:hypothetical protein
MVDIIFLLLFTMQESEGKLQESVENCVPLQGSAAKIKKVLSDLQKESLKRARDAATIYRKQLREEKQRLGIDKKSLTKLQMRVRELQRVEPIDPPTPPEESAPEESAPEESPPEFHGFFRDGCGNLFMK